MTADRRPSDLRGPAEDLGLPDPEAVAALRWPVKVSSEAEEEDRSRIWTGAGGWVSPEGLILDDGEVLLAAAWPEVALNFTASHDTGGLVFGAYGFHLWFLIEDWETRRMVLRWWMTGQPASMLANATLAASAIYSKEAEGEHRTDPEGAEE